MPELLASTEPEPAAPSVQETKPATQSDQECEPVPTSVPVGVLVELDEFGIPQCGAIDFLMTSCAQALPPLLVLSVIQVFFIADGTGHS